MRSYGRDGRYFARARIFCSPNGRFYSWCLRFPRCVDSDRFCLCPPYAAGSVCFISCILGFNICRSFSVLLYGNEENTKTTGNKRSYSVKYDAFVFCFTCRLFFPFLFPAPALNIPGEKALSV